MQRTSSTEMEVGGGGGMNSILSRTHSQVSMEDLHHHHHQNGHGHGHSFHESQNSQQHDDFLEQMLSTIPNCGWPPQEHEHEHEHEHDLSSSNPNSHHLNHPALKSGDSPDDDPADADHPAAAFHYPFEDSSLASKLRQINGKSLLLQQQLLLSRGSGGGGGPGLRSPSGDPGMLGLPLSLGSGDSVDPNSPFKSPAAGGGGSQQGVGDASVQALYNGFAAGSLHGNAQPPQFHPSQGGSQNFGGPAAVMNQGPPASASTGGSSGGAPQRQRVRARRGQATDPHSIAERLRRERIAERMKALQELVPNANKTDKASMLDEIIDYVKFLQLQVKVLSMSRLGGAGAVAPLVADMSSEGVGGARTPNSNGNGNGNGTASTNESMTMTEQQVAKLMEEDMGSAMQYLQGKGLCLMPISLATAISTATCHSRNPLPPTSRPHINHHDGGGLGGVAGEVAGPTSPNMSVLTVQSANAATTADPSVKDTTTTTSATKP